MLEIIKGRDDYEFVILSAKTNELINYFQKRPIDTVLWVDFKKCSENDVRSLLSHEDLGDINAVHFVNSSPLINEFESFLHWEYLSFGFEESIFDFSKLINVLYLGGIWSSKWTGLNSNTSLKIFAVSGYKDVFLQIPNLESLKEIDLIQPTIVNLQGVEKAVDLEVLEISYAKKLQDISMINNRHMRKLVIDSCKKIESFKSIEALHSLEYLQIIRSMTSSKTISLNKLENLKFVRLS